MTFDPTLLLQPDRGQPARNIHIVEVANFADWRTGQPPRVRAALDAGRIEGTAGATTILPGEAAGDWAVLLVTASATLGVWDLAKLAETLPDGHYRLAAGATGAAKLGWALGHYSFDRYKKPERSGTRVLLCADAADIGEAAALASATATVRDLVNIAAADLGPAELEAEAAALAARHGAVLNVTKGAALASGYPMIHAVGQAAAAGREPRLIELTWGNPANPRIAVIGKGVCFDSGGLDIKPSSAMRLMKKDMGGAAHALALAGLIMNARLPVRLQLLIPAVENAIAGNAFRPGDVLKTRKGLTVENTNTDAEGRLVLGDAITRAGEDNPALIVDFATLTGAARVALGPDLPALFSNDEALAGALLAEGGACEDPLWRLPLWDGYGEMLKSDVADLVNAADSGFAGAITAALFLRRFVPDGTAWAHLDTFAWRPGTKAGRPKGGDALGLRAVWGMLRARYDSRS